MNYSTYYSSTELYSTQLYYNLLFTLNSMSCISPKTEPFLAPLEAGNMSRHCVDAHAAHPVQPQGLTSRRKADEKNVSLLSLNEMNLNRNLCFKIIFCWFLYYLTISNWWYTCNLFNFQLARNPDNLEELSQNETLLGALSRYFITYIILGYVWTEANEVF